MTAAHCIYKEIDSEGKIKNGARLKIYAGRVSQKEWRHLKNTIFLQIVPIHLNGNYTYWQNMEILSSIFKILKKLPKDF